MKGSLAEAVERAHNDPELLNLTTEVALLQARLGQLIDKIEPEESLGRWKKAQEQFKMLLDARARKDGVGFGQSLEELRIIFRDGLHDHLIWSEIRDTLKDLRGIVAQEQKRRMDMNALISADQAVGMISEILYAAKEHVSDPKELNALYRAAQDIITRNPSLNR